MTLQEFISQHRIMFLAKRADEDDHWLVTLRRGGTKLTVLVKASAAHFEALQKILDGGRFAVADVSAFTGTNHD